ncbi:hypothetical protein HY523_01095, partial [Candidatus Berkelbacteria bacterium]|nr:hypothetical protein [Candidatus Berkelbacteria bacterium]
MDDQQQRGVDQSSQPVPPPPVLPPAMPASAPPPVIPAPLPVPVVPPPPTPVSVPSNLPVSPLGAAAEVPVINRTTKPATAIEPQPDANLAVTPPPAAPRPALPWKLIGGITGGLIAIVGGGFLLWWLGIGFGAPRDPVK